MPSRTPPAAKPQPRGYTLIEMLIVISLMGVLAALLLPRFEPSTYDQLQGAAQIISADIAYARNLAVTNDSHYSLTFDRATNSYTLRHTGHNNLLDVLPITPYRHSGEAPDAQVTYLEDLPHLGPRVELIGVSKGSGSVSTSSTLEFNSLGGLEGAQPVTIWIACGEDDSRRYLSLVVAPVTGLVTMGEFQATAP
jgi:prepilin-type N-terminal cleavage/methylation domain-containing protein